MIKIDIYLRGGGVKSLHGTTLKTEASLLSNFRKISVCFKDSWYKNMEITGKETTEAIKLIRKQISKIDFIIDCLCVDVLK